MNRFFTIRLCYPLILILFSIAVKAQKITSVQQKGVRTPVNLKIDGTTREWNDRFQAYNNATSVFYTIANNDELLYFAIRAKDQDIISKILIGGITITVVSDGDKNGKAFTFPLIENGELASLRLKMPAFSFDSLTNSQKTDSVVKARNEKVIENLNEIGISGVKDITDSVISIYNEQGIEGAARFDRQLAFTCEIVVPLRYLNISPATMSKIQCNIKLNGITGKNVTVKYSPGRRTIFVFLKNKLIFGRPAIPQNMGNFFPTDFSLDYQLAAK
jgi:hypothetical protein